MVLLERLPETPRGQKTMSSVVGVQHSDSTTSTVTVANSETKVVNPTGVKGEGVSQSKPDKASADEVSTPTAGEGRAGVETASHRGPSHEGRVAASTPAPLPRRSSVVTSTPKVPQRRGSFVTSTPIAPSTVKRGESKFPTMLRS